MAASFSRRLLEQGLGPRFDAAGIRGNLQLVVSGDVLDVTERNLRRSAPRALPAVEHLRQSVPWELCPRSEAMARDTACVVAANDAPIVAAPRQANAASLLPNDRKDLLSIRAAITAAFGVETMTPEAILRMLGR